MVKDKSNNYNLFLPEKFGEEQQMTIAVAVDNLETPGILRQLTVVEDKQTKIRGGKHENVSKTKR